MNKGFFELTTYIPHNNLVTIILLLIGILTIIFDNKYFYIFVSGGFTGIQFSNLLYSIIKWKQNE